MTEKRAREDWAAHLEALETGDPRALLKLTRLVNGFLARWNAYDFRDDWEDLIQEVLIGALRAHREGRIRERAHTYGFLKTVARNKFADRLKGHLRSPADKSLPWEDVIETDLDPGRETLHPDLSHDLAEALAALGDKHRACVLAVHLEGKTHDEAVEATGIPLGSLRRYLREGLVELQQRLGGPSGLRSRAAAQGSQKSGRSDAAPSTPPARREEAP